MVFAAEESGAAMVELGMPFSDPLADGPIIQESSQKAIENGVTLQWILDTVAEIRQQSEIPLAIMGYINPILKYGLKEFMSNCREVGIDGLIIPDLPPEEAEEYIAGARENGISPILFVAPNTTAKRIREISKLAGTLIYCVAILGITGGMPADKEALQKYLQRVEANSKCPFVVGFGIKEREDVVEINKMAHGAVVGSAIIQDIQRNANPVETVKNYIKKLTK